MQFQPKTIHVNGAELHYLEQGTGDPLVFVHGGLSDFRSWAFQIEPFSQHYRVITYSRRYHYPNAWTDDRPAYLAALHRDDLATLMKQLGLTPAHIVGSSYGAYIALLLAVDHQELVRTLVLGEPPAFPLVQHVPWGESLLQAHMTNVIDSSRQAFQSGNAERGIRTFIDAVVGQGAFDLMPPPARGMMLDNAREMQLEVSTPVELYFSTFTCKDARRIEAPTFLLTGELSPRWLWLITDELERCLSNTERTMIPGASHGMHNMNPQAYNETVLAFLAKH